MVRHRKISPAARNVLAILADAGNGSLHGYELCRRAGVKSGTLYPLLIRLEGLGFLEARWVAATEPGRPPRHAYRLTATGRDLARDNPPLAATGDWPVSAVKPA